MAVGVPQECMTTALIEQQPLSRHTPGERLAPVQVPHAEEHRRPIERHERPSASSSRSTSSAVEVLTNPILTRPPCSRRPSRDIGSTA